MKSKIILPLCYRQDSPPQAKTPPFQFDNKAINFKCDQVGKDLNGKQAKLFMNFFFFLNKWESLVLKYILN